MYFMHIQILFGKFYRLDEYLFKENRLYIPNNSRHGVFVCKAYRGGLMGNFDVTKTLDVLQNTFIGLKWKRIYKEYVINTLYVEKLSLRFYCIACILLCMYQETLGEYFYKLCFRFT